MSVARGTEQIRPGRGHGGSVCACTCVCVSAYVYFSVGSHRRDKTWRKRVDTCLPGLLASAETETLTFLPRKPRLGLGKQTSPLRLVLPVTKVTKCPTVGHGRPPVSPWAPQQTLLLTPSVPALLYLGTQTAGAIPVHTISHSQPGYISVMVPDQPHWRAWKEVHSPL